MNNNIDEFETDLDNENIEPTETDDTTEVVTTEVREEVKQQPKRNNQVKKPNIKKAPIKKSGMKSGTKAQLITLVIVLIFWIIVAILLIFGLKNLFKKTHDTQDAFLNTTQTVVEPLTTTNMPETYPIENTPVTNVPEPIENTPAPQSIPQENTNNNFSQQNTVNQPLRPEQVAEDDYDLIILDMVYDEVINNRNEAYLYNFSSDELAIIRNTLYAKRGYRFKKKKYQQYFGSKPWYRPTTDSQNILPKNEERLANIIKKYE